MFLFCFGLLTSIVTMFWTRQPLAAHETTGASADAQSDGLRRLRNGSGQRCLEVGAGSGALAAQHLRADTGLRPEALTTWIWFVLQCDQKHGEKRVRSCNLWHVICGCYGFHAGCDGISCWVGCVRWAPKLSLNSTPGWKALREGLPLGHLSS